MSDPASHYHGHRQRLRERFVKSGLHGLAEHEVVELLLTLVIPRSDVKQPAKALLARFGSLRDILDTSAPEAALRRGAASIVLAHNHPNGQAAPSEQDKLLTRAITLAADTVRLRMLDHLVVTADTTFSFRKAGLL